MVSLVSEREPELDPAASALLGTDAERLSGLAQLQPYSSRGPWLDSDSVALLDVAADGGRVGRFQRAGKAGALAVLGEAGLMDPGGRLTPEGLSVTAPLSGNRAALKLESSFGGRSAGMQVLMNEQDAMLLAGPSHAELTGPEPEQHREMLQLDLVGLNDLFPALAAWLGIGPAWTVPAAPVTVPVATLNRRLAAPEEPVPTADPSWVRMWNQPWFLWHVADAYDPGENTGWGYIGAGTAGHFRVVVDGEAATITPTQSSRVYRELMDAVEGALLRGSGS
ncbi:hypothetical protein [Arthrobacter sp. zg-Y179]|uniref:hypothetical protein n=1 Tax=Arthrobacter sp. zg-Y179 TaxID=2894188 RepID=UPI001E640462|nr:hypothetical protein [Arthrobacter sp. zg-Y179]MCC9175573.1 hypothetical protein [Arthrobacter sp. zg-Y179]